MMFSIGNCKPTLLVELLKQIDKYIAQEEFVFIFKDHNSRRTKESTIEEAKRGKNGRVHRMPYRSADRMSRQNGQDPKGVLTPLLDSYS